MKNLFATDFIKNTKTGEISNDIETVMRWVADGVPVEFDLLDLENYFRSRCGVMSELKEIVEKDGQLFLREEFKWDDDLDDQDELVRFDYPFFGFTKDVSAVMYLSWVIYEIADEGVNEKPEYTRNLQLVKEWLIEGKKLVCDIYSFGEVSQTAQILELRELYGVPYILTATGKKYVLEPQRRLFECDDILAWPEAVKISKRND